MATIADVAKRAGVSMMTVSRVINKSDHVSEITTKKVNQAIRELKYRPNMVARGLVTRHTRMIAYVVSNLANPFFAAVSTGIQNVCAEKGYTMIVFDITNAERFEECRETLVARRIDGVVFHHLNVQQTHIDTLRANGICCVTIDNEIDLECVTSIESDDYSAAAMATRHLIELGYQRIGCVHGQYDDSFIKKEKRLDYTQLFQRRIWRNRTDGFLDEMRKASLTPVCMIEGRGSADIAFAADETCLKQVFDAAEPPCALYCQNDILGLAVLSEALRRKLSVPQDIAIIGHDGLDFAMELYPRLTTVCQPRYDMGTLSARSLIDAIENKSPTVHIMTESKIVRGDTT